MQKNITDKISITEKKSEKQLISEVLLYAKK